MAALMDDQKAVYSVEAKAFSLDECLVDVLAAVMAASSDPLEVAL